MQAPCKNCPDRHYLCHSTCEKYLAFRKYQDEYLEYKKKQGQLNNDLWATSRHHKKYRQRPYKDGYGDR